MKKVISILVMSLVFFTSTAIFQNNAYGVTSIGMPPGGGWVAPIITEPRTVILNEEVLISLSEYQYGGYNKSGSMQFVPSSYTLKRPDGTETTVTTSSNTIKSHKETFNQLGTYHLSAIYIIYNYNDFYNGYRYWGPITSQLEINLLASAGTGGVVSSTGGVYQFGDPICITATANSGYRFKDWTVTGTDIVNGNNANPATFKMPTTPVILKANFTEIVLPSPKATQFTHNASTAKEYNGMSQGVKVIPKPGVGKVTAIYYNGLMLEPKNIGTFAVTIDVEAGEDYGSIKNLELGTFNILPKKTSISNITVGKKQMKVKWKKVSAAQGITNYQLRYRVKGTSGWTTKRYAASKSVTIIKGLKKGKKYQVQVRSYKTISKVKYCSAWSVVKTSGKIK